MGPKFFYVFICPFQFDQDVVVSTVAFRNEEEFFEVYSDRCKIINKFSESTDEAECENIIYSAWKSMQDARAKQKGGR